MNIKKSILSAMVLGAVAFTFSAAQPVQAAIGFETPAPAENLEKPATVTTPHHINIDGKVLEPAAGKQNVAYVDGQPLVALRPTAEALGYTVLWDNATKTALVDMSIATLAVQPDVAQVVRKGKLQIINLDASESMLPAARFIDGQLFVSPNAFKLLLNNVKVSKDEIFIAPQRAQLASTGSTAGVQTNGLDTFLPAEKTTKADTESTKETDTTTISTTTKTPTKPVVTVKRTTTDTNKDLHPENVRRNGLER